MICIDISNRGEIFGSQGRAMLLNVILLSRSFRCYLRKIRLLPALKSMLKAAKGTNWIIGLRNCKYPRNSNFYLIGLLTRKKVGSLTNVIFKVMSRSLFRKSWMHDLIKVLTLDLIKL